MSQVHNTVPVYFIGAGPGDVELLTLKAQRLISQADLILYAGSLVPDAVLAFARPGIPCLDTSSMQLDEQIDRMAQAAGSGQQVVRLHTGDPSLYGAIHEQMCGLDAAAVPYIVVPGVSSAFAAAAALKLEYTLPGVTQTAIFTRMGGGRTPVPERERLRDLAAHGSSLVIFLSTGMAAGVVEELAAAGYAPDTPLAVVYRAGWPDELVLHSTLAALPQELETREITHQALIIVSPALQSGDQLALTRSHLYGSALDGVSQREAGPAILCLTRQALALAERLLPAFSEGQLYAPQRFLSSEQEANRHISGFRTSIRQTLQDAFQRYDSLVCIMAAGLVMRELAPLLRNKHSDPAVVLMDAAGRYAVSLLSGHAGGANELARRLAELTGGQAVITTASDVGGMAPLDLIGKEEGWRLEDGGRLTALMAAMVNGEGAAVFQDAGDEGWWTKYDTSTLQRCTTLEELAQTDVAALLAITPRLLPQSLHRKKPVIYRPPCLALGLGCNRGTPSEEILQAVDDVLQQAGLSHESVAAVASVSDKAGEPGFIEACRQRDWSLQTYSHEDINALPHTLDESSGAYRALGVWGVAEPCAMLAAASDHLLLPKRKFTNVTVAVAVVDGMWRMS